MSHYSTFREISEVRFALLYIINLKWLNHIQRVGLYHAQVLGVFHEKVIISVLN